mmetsp:Transcript_10556/g.29117  ORF Transcript_10556/g.29117 Transcript_10556/m.29117 type:complete len:200 (-) Transcript_10556:1642-2241(-)|eukprot:CAMPEP_0198120630 /NCGR_PEP_ID=MMETSP1442-20131203/29705_1 /TAXON_ID= /ORGANISM="Craspedostauros australis, Strain CCMP3328" /LENGTH=199 /DNA_ID=CAMNT_0043779303 /DNA_START=139 /DNA_END=738 /DNA_ORIENTATION=+
MSAAAQTPNTNARKGEADAKIIKDLETMEEKMDLCEAMLNPGGGQPPPSLKTSQAMLSVVGFLEACAPRMVQLVEVAAQGALSEDVLIKCLECNDRLQRILEDIDANAISEAAASTTAASATPDVTSQFDDLLLNSEEDKNKGAVTGPGKSTGLETPDPFATNNTPAPTSDAGGGIQQSTSNDEFDDFINHRSSAGAGL